MVKYGVEQLNDIYADQVDENKQLTYILKIVLSLAFNELVDLIANISTYRYHNNIDVLCVLMIVCGRVVCACSLICREDTTSL